jgi:glycosyltransferase involved in cell wall biosynthesis
MRVVVLGHSLIHSRQQLFFDYMNSLDGVEVLQIYPKRWGSQERKGGFKVSNEGSIREFTFWDDAFEAIRAFSPEILYSMTEFWQSQAFRSRRWARALKIPLVFFFWENLQAPSNAEVNLINDAKLIICGNKECEEIINKACPDVHTEVIPQIGIRTDIFKPMPEEEKLTDVLFVGRRTHEKGIEYVDRLEQDRFDVWRLGDEKYENMTKVYNGVRVLAVPSLTTDQWREQWPACIAESLACGVPVVAFDSGSIRSNYSSSGITLIKEGDYEGLKLAVETIINEKTILPKAEISSNSRNWVLKHMGHKDVAKNLLNKFGELR